MNPPENKKNGRKRERTVNWRAEEEELLIELVTKNRDVIENKKSDALTWKDKEACWKRIVAEFNEADVNILRTIEQVKLKYNNLKKSVRKKSAERRRELFGTGGGRGEADELSTTEEKVKNMIKLSVEGLPAEFDSDVMFTDKQEVIFTLEEDGNLLMVGANENDQFDNSPIPSSLEQNDSSSPDKSSSSWEQVICQKNSIVDVPSVSQVVSTAPGNPLKRKRSAALKTKRKTTTSSAEATNLLKNRNDLVELQKQVMMVKKRVLLLKEEKLKLELIEMKKRTSYDTAEANSSPYS